MSECWHVIFLLALRTTRFATFPPYLMVQMAKFTLGDDWVPKKYGQFSPLHHYYIIQYVFVVSLTDVLIDVPEELDISHLRGCGLQAGEVELPEGDAPASQEQPQQQGSCQY